MQIVVEAVAARLLAVSQICDFRVHLVYLIVGVKLEEVISGPPEQGISSDS